MQLGFLVIHILVVAQFDAAQGVHHLGEAAEGELGYMVDVLTSDRFHLRHEFLLAEHLHDGIDLEHLVADLHEGIAGH